MEEKIEYKGFFIEIKQDEFPESPRECEDNFGTMVCFHKRYSLGDKHNYNSDDYTGWDELEQTIVKNEKPVLIYPLYLYDHSGLRIKIGSFDGLLPQGHAEFDSGRIGFIYVNAEKILEEFNKKRITKKILKKTQRILEQEVKTYDDYLRGNVWGFIVTDKDGEQLDSCWGFVGDPEYVQEEAKSSIDHLLFGKNGIGEQQNLKL